MSEKLNMDFEIIPYVGAEPLRLGATRAEVRNVLESDFHEFRKTRTSENTADHFTELGVFGFYDGANHLEAIEFTNPSSPTYLGEGFFHKDFDENRRDMLKLDPSAEIESDTITSYKLGIAIWSATSSDDPHAAIDTILVFERGYYD